MTPWKRRLVAQFGGPSGVFGGVAGWIMAYRHGNRRRNRWAISLLGIEAADRILEIGFGPGLALVDACRQAPEGEVVGLDHSETMLRQAGDCERRSVPEEWIFDWPTSPRWTTPRDPSTESSRSTPFSSGASRSIVCEPCEGCCDPVDGSQLPSSRRGVVPQTATRS